MRNRKYSQPLFVPTQVVEFLFFLLVLGSLTFGYEVWQALLGP